MPPQYPRLDLRSPGPVARRRSLILQAITALSGAYLLVCVVLVIGKCWISSAWWGFQVLHFSARILFLITPLGLLSLTLAARSLKGSLLNLASLGLVAGPLMGLTLGGLLSSPPHVPPESVVKIMTSNTGGSASHLLGLLWEVRKMAPDIIMMQEVSRESASIIEEQLADWNCLQSGPYLVAAKGTVTHLGECVTTPFQRKTAVACEVTTPQGALVVINLHLSTARWGLQKLGWSSPLTNKGVSDFLDCEHKRQLEAHETREWVNTLTAGRNFIIGGDFNSPPGYEIYESAWGDLSNSFCVRGVGYGYTALSNKRALWPDNFPWVRIDHLLYGNSTTCQSITTGDTGSSDHRTVSGIFALGESE